MEFNFDRYRYDVAIEGVNAKDAHERTGQVHTYAENPHNFRIVALSCDRPERLLDGETNMWVKLADQVKAGEGTIPPLNFSSVPLYLLSSPLALSSLLYTYCLRCSRKFPWHRSLSYSFYSP